MSEVHLITGRDLIRLLMEEFIDLDAPVVLRTPDTLPPEASRNGDHVDWNLQGIWLDTDTYNRPVIALTEYGVDDD